jgi:hypothetical protein
MEGKIRFRVGGEGSEMCCDLCDAYYNCEEANKMRNACCSRCEELPDCYGDTLAGQKIVEDEFDEDVEMEDKEEVDYDEEEEDFNEKEFKRTQH